MNYSIFLQKELEQTKNILVEIVNGCCLDPMTPEGYLVVSIETINKARALLRMDKVDVEKG